MENRKIAKMINYTGLSIIMIIITILFWENINSRILKLRIIEANLTMRLAWFQQMRIIKLI